MYNRTLRLVTDHKPKYGVFSAANKNTYHLLVQIGSSSIAITYFVIYLLI